MESTFKQSQKNEISNLLTDMVLRKASTEELARALRHSMVVMDSEKPGLDISQSEKDNDMESLRKKYQPFSYIKERKISMGKLLVIMVGPPACGKTTIARSIGEKYPNSVEVVCSDGIRAELHGNEEVQLNNQEVFRIFYERAAQHLDEGKSVILDATNVLRANRDTAMEKLYGKADYIVGAVYRVDAYYALEGCLERNAERKRHVPENVIKRMFNSLCKPKNRPTLDEGFDILIDMANLEGFMDVVATSSAGLVRPE